MAGPLEGLRVLDISTIVAAPFAATLLADYGAEVVKVELPGLGDGARQFGPFRDGKSLWWKVLNRNKRFVTLDLRTAEGRDTLMAMLPDFDVLVENFRPGTLDRWGLTKEVLWACQPNLKILRVTGFGQTGPMKDMPAFARVFEAMSGLTYITGEPDGEPMHAGYPIGDMIGGLFGAVSILAACFSRDGTSSGPEEIDLSLSEAVLRLLEFLPIEYDQLGVVRQRSGNRNQYSAPSAVYRTGDDKWVTLAGSTNAIFRNNCRAIGQEDLADDPRFASNPLRVDHSDELNGIFAGFCAAHDLETILERFRAVDGAIAPIYDISQICADPQFVAREAIVAVEDEDFGSVRMQNVVPRFAERPARLRHSARSLGRDTDDVLSRYAANPDRAGKPL